MKIAVLVPSYNEEKNIVNVLTKIDEGISRNFVAKDCAIFHIDNGSTDSTLDISRTFVTATPKKVIDNSSASVSGKGSNIYKGLEEAKDYDATLMFDSDLKTFDPEWVKLFASKILDDKVDLVSPVYSRNRYEGNTTNHFSCPLLSVCFDSIFYQPIAGDFGFSKRMAKAIHAAFSWDSDFKYGVDTLITWTAMGNSMKVSQIPLGKKIHNPSFGKIVPMFSEVALSTFRQIYLYKDKISSVLSKDLQLLHAPLNFINIDSEFVSKPSMEAVASLTNQVQTMFSEPYYKTTLERYDLNSVTTLPWHEAISLISYRVLRMQELSLEAAADLVRIIAPLYLTRVINYFNQIDGLDAAAINTLLVTQLKDIAQSLSNHVKNEQKI